jgi:hypothetical protein
MPFNGSASWKSSYSSLIIQLSGINDSADSPRTVENPGTNAESYHLLQQDELLDQASTSHSGT